MSGERRTRQRDAIRRVFAEAGRPLSTAEAHRLAAALVDGLGIATVYRNVRGFVEDGELGVVELPGEPPRYETTGKGHHHHIH